MLPWATSWWGGEQGIVERRNANKRENEKEGGREAAAESVTSSWNLHRALGGGTESCFRGVLKGLYKLLPPVSSKRETVQIRKWSWSWNLNSLSHHTPIFSTNSSGDIFYLWAISYQIVSWYDEMLRHEFLLSQRCFFFSLKGTVQVIFSQILEGISFRLVWSNFLILLCSWASGRTAENTLLFK